MRLVDFKVKDFRSVKDSGQIHAENVTAFVGVNESGKSNLLLPLWKFHPAKEGGIEPTSDYPKNNYQAIRANPEGYEFVKITFDIGPTLADEFSKLTGFEANKIRRVEMSKRYDNSFTWNFPDAVPPKNINSDMLGPIFEELKNVSAVAAELETEVGLKTKTATLAGSLPSKNQLTKAEFSSAFQKFESLFSAQLDKSSTLSSILSATIGKLKEVGKIFDGGKPTDNKELWPVFIKKVPVFLYYSNYGNLDSEIYLPHVVENLTRTNLGAREAAKARTLKVLFNFVGLNPKEILELGRDFKDPANPGRQPTEPEIEIINKNKKERSILLQSAGTKLTTKFRDWWKQGDYRFRFEADGDHFRIWVSDDRRPDEVELEGRSTGLQWFLSFYLVFLVESEDEHKNAILLLDEPGLSLHPLAQKNLSLFFENLSSTNQILYTTHSPFLIDSDNLDHARKVYVSEDGTTKATSNLNEGESKKSQKGASYALNSALNLSVAESLLIGCDPIIVEGPSDQFILTAIKTKLIGGGHIKPLKELVFPPGGGAKSVKIISSILLGRDDDLPFVLLDDDDIGRSAANELKKELYNTSENKVLNLRTFLGMEHVEIEDLVPVQIYIDIVDREFKIDEMFKDNYQAGKAIVPQIEKWAKQNELELRKGWKVPLAISIKKKLMSAKMSEIDLELQKKWVALFEAFIAK